MPRLPSSWTTPGKVTPPLPRPARSNVPLLFLRRIFYNIQPELPLPQLEAIPSCLSIHWSWNLMSRWVERGTRAPAEAGGLEDLSWETAHRAKQSHRGNSEGELTWERSRFLSRGGGKKLLALCQTKNELFWPLYCSGYPMTIQYFHPGQRHVFWERFTMLAWAILHKLILQWKHTSATRIQWNCIIISVFSFQRLSDKPKL